MKGIEEWFELYGQSHRHPVNVVIHKLAAIPVLAFYLRLSFALFVGMTALAALGLVICHSWQGPLLWPALAGFVLLWIAQFVGHKIEGKRPSFLTDLQFLLIGPAWVLASLYRRLGIPY
ncbi:hypothetical protein B7G55_03435 [Aeromonas hydrophila]|uniref:Mpo1 family 2-hydroxy fatty acid dioxygenase n=1 Tax=Aeromonas hydrophila TaxID=644 RepID=UPI00044A8D72|nr:Mpo1-like protein [Aeromonas hydrophila]EZH84596.1 hypothetical protein AT59_04125 [Aeromonas hydrophila AD9]KHE15785.1 hypothetical protein OI71_07435 [Aeromonas hydrophila]OSP52621.1 hypothetical protein B7G55_03435 [Aeromonas hydrophila]